MVFAIETQNHQTDPETPTLLYQDVAYRLTVQLRPPNGIIQLDADPGGFPQDHMKRQGNVCRPIYKQNTNLQRPGAHILCKLDCRAAFSIDLAPQTPPAARRLGGTGEVRYRFGSKPLRGFSASSAYFPGGVQN